MEKKNENGKVQLKGQLKLYIQWPAIMALLLIAMDLWVYKMDHRADSQEIGLPVSSNGLVLPCGASGRWEA